MNASSPPSDKGPSIRKPLVLYFLTGVFTVLYILFIFGEGMSFEKPDMQTISVFLLFIFYLTAYVLSWFREKIAGYMFATWYVIMMTLAFYVWTGAGMTIIMGFPALPIGAFYILYAYRKENDPPPSISSQWRLVLRVLMVTYTAIFLIGKADELSIAGEEGIFGGPYLFLVILSVLFLVAFIFSWTREAIAGILLITWYIGIFALKSGFPDLPNEIGPMLLLGFPLLVQGILYLVYHRIIKKGDVWNT